MNSLKSTREIVLLAAGFLLIKTIAALVVFPFSGIMLTLDLCIAACLWGAFANLTDEINRRKPPESNEDV